MYNKHSLKQVGKLLYPNMTINSSNINLLPIFLDVTNKTPKDENDQYIHLPIVMDSEGKTIIIGRIILTIPNTKLLLKGLGEFEVHLSESESYTINDMDSLLDVTIKERRLNKN